MAIASIQQRFDQPGFVVYQNLQELLTKAAKKECYQQQYDYIISFYKDDFNPIRLKTQLDLLGTQLSDSDNSSQGHLTFFDVVNFLRDLSAAQKEFFSEVTILAKLLLVMPATNASSERAFSSLRRTKTYLRNTMGQECLNHVMLLNIHKEHADNLVPSDIANEFVHGSEHHFQIFGKF